MSVYLRAFIGIGSLLGLASCALSKRDEYEQQCKEWLSPTGYAENKEWYPTSFGSCKVWINEDAEDEEIEELKKNNECPVTCFVNLTLDWAPIEYMENHYLCSESEYFCRYSARFQRLTNGTNSFSRNPIFCSPSFFSHSYPEWVKDIELMKDQNSNRGNLCMKVK